MDPREWGRPAWHTIRNVVLTTDPAAKPDALAAFVRAFALVLPCSACVTNFAATLLKYPPETYFATAAGRKQWYDLVRAEVRTHEAPRPGRPGCMRALLILMLVLALGVVWYISNSLTAKV